MIKKKLIALLLAGVMVVSIYSLSGAAPKRGLLMEEEVIQELQKDVNGDQVKDRILLIGEKEKKDAIFNMCFMIKVIDGKTNKETTIKLEDFAGYGGEIFLADFTGDQVADIMVTTNSGGSGGIIFSRIITLEDHEIKIIFNEKDNQGLNFEGKFVNGFKAELQEANFKKVITIDLSAFKDLYIESKIYDSNGKILEKVEPWTDPFSVLEPIDIDGDGVYELKGFQAISGAFHANRISDLISLWKYGNGKWKIKEAKYSTTLDL